MGCKRTSGWNSGLLGLTRGICDALQQARKARGTPPHLGNAGHDAQAV